MPLEEKWECVLGIVGINGNMMGMKRVGEKDNGRKVRI